ncbi:hypothetical protein HW132_35655 [Brasilonema sp. CT11]|nr:hypothetical protein [Brasilonema sp. CT11]
MLTTSYAALKYDEGTKVSNDRARLVTFDKTRVTADETKRQNKLIEDYFAVDFYGFLQQTYPNSAQILGALGSRVYYFKTCFEEVSWHKSFSRVLIFARLLHLPQKTSLINRSC